MQDVVITVSVLNGYLKKIIDAEEMLYNISVVGEIGNFSYSGGNAYFTLKDKDALLNCTMFGMELNFSPKIGDKVIATGTPKYYVKGGRLTFNVINLSLYGEGELYKRFLELKNRLEKEGLFDVAHKKPLPEKISRIGVVTSETGAVIHDIINVTTRRSSDQDIVLFPVKVQGIGADREIAKGIEYFNNSDVDAVMVCRGGGSEEDLSCFNSEIVARAIYNCKKFIVCAVGHETDFTIADYVADLRAPTPSAGAELLTKDMADRREKLELLLSAMQSAIYNKLNLENNKLYFYLNGINNSIEKLVLNEDNKLKNLSNLLSNLNPKAMIEMGYAKLEKDGKPIKEVREVKTGDNIKIYMKGGKLDALIRGVE